MSRAFCGEGCWSCANCPRADRCIRDDKGPINLKTPQPLTKEERKAKRAVYYQDHKAELNAKRSAYRAANPEKAAAYQRAYYARNREAILAKQAANRAAHREEINAYQRAQYRKRRSKTTEEGQT